MSVPDMMEAEMEGRAENRAALVAAAAPLFGWKVEEKR